MLRESRLRRDDSRMLGGDLTPQQSLNHLFTLPRLDLPLGPLSSFLIREFFHIDELPWAVSGGKTSFDVVMIGEPDLRILRRPDIVPVV